MKRLWNNESQIWESSA